MRIEIDTRAKIIKLKDKTKLHEFVDYLRAHVKDWGKYTLDASPEVTYWPGLSDPYKNPMNPINPRPYRPTWDPNIILGNEPIAGSKRD